MLDLVKQALRITTEDFDDELNNLIAAAIDDLGLAGVIDTDTPEDPDPLVRTAVCTYCKLHFGDPEHADRFKASYDEQKAQLATATGHTEWGTI